MFRYIALRSRANTQTFQLLTRFLAWSIIHSHTDTRLRLSHDQLPARVVVCSSLITLLGQCTTNILPLCIVLTRRHVHAWAKPRDRAAHHTRDTVVKDQAIVVRWLTSSHCLPRGRVIEDDDQDYVSHHFLHRGRTKDFEGDRFRRGEGKNNCGGSER